MPPSNFRLRFDHGWKHLMLVGGSLSLAYAIAFLTTMNQWINFWLRGSYYISYQILFLAVLLLIFMLRLSRHDSGSTLGITIIIFGGIAGYAAGLIAFLLHPMFQEDSFHEVLATLQFPAREAVIAFLWFPVRLLSWLFGAITGVVLVVITRTFRTYYSSKS